jgi:hypothetical protein
LDGRWHTNGSRDLPNQAWKNYKTNPSLENRPPEVPGESFTKIKGELFQNVTGWRAKEYHLFMS